MGRPKGSKNGSKKTAPKRPAARKVTGLIMLSELQMKFIDENWQRVGNVRDLTSETFGKNVDGRSLEGKAVKEYLDQMGYDLDAIQVFKLTEEQKTFIDNNYESMAALDMANILFENREIHPMGEERRAIDDYIKENYGGAAKKFNDDGEEIVPYNPPTSVKAAVPIIRKKTGKNLGGWETIPKEDRERVESVITYLNCYRFKKAIENYERPEDRDLFEASFIDYTYDKPDLTPSEIQIYINVCTDQVKMHRYEKQLDSLNNRRNRELVDERQVSVALTEAIDKATVQYDKAAARVSKNINSLEGTRNERMKNVVDKNKTLLALIEQMQTKEGRDQLLHIQRMQESLVKEEINRIADAGQEIAKIMGIHANEVARP